jgi:hypothetical protein
VAALEVVLGAVISAGDQPLQRAEGQDVDLRRRPLYPLTTFLHL